MDFLVRYHERTGTSNEREVYGVGNALNCDTHTLSKLRTIHKKKFDLIDHIQVLIFGCIISIS